MHIAQALYLYFAFCVDCLGLQQLTQLPFSYTARKKSRRNNSYTF